MILKNKLILLFCAGFLAAGCSEKLQRPSIEYVFNNPAESGTRYPNLYQDSTGTVFMSWILNIDENIHAVQYATLTEGGWSPVETILQENDLFVNWADFPSAVGTGGEIVAAHWLKKKPGGPYAYDVNIAFPDEQSRRLPDPLVPHTDNTAAEHGFVSMEPLPGDKVLAVWLDGRNTEGREHDEYGNFEKAMTLRSAEISRSGELTRERVIDHAVCDCCQTDLAATEGGFVVVYRDRKEGEIRDISVSSYDLETGTWSEPAAVHEDGWEIAGCPVNGPRIVSEGRNTAVAWYTMADDEPRVLVARSGDGGEGFGEPVPVAGAGPVGRVDLAFGSGGSLYVSWMEQEDEMGNIWLREIGLDSEPGEPVYVGATTSSRSSGFPRIVKLGSDILVAWTQTDPVIRVRTAKVPVD